MIIDAGGGTIDISTYEVVNDKPLQVEELYEPECESNASQCRLPQLTRFVLGLLQGGEFVTARARAMVKGASKSVFRRSVTQLTSREAQRLQIQHSR